MNPKQIYPRKGNNANESVYLKSVVKDPTIIVGDFTMYNDFEKDPRDFERNNVLYHYPLCNKEKLVIGKYCSIACGAKFMFTGGNHSLKSLSTYPFPVFPDEWGLDEWDVARA